MRWRDERRRQPAAIGQFVAPLAEDGEMLAGIGGGVLFQNPGAGFIKMNFDGEPARRVNDFCRNDVGLGQNGFLRDGDEDGIGTQHGDGLARAQVSGLASIWTRKAPTGPRGLSVSQPQSNARVAASVK